MPFRGAGADSQPTKAAHFSGFASRRVCGFSSRESDTLCPQEAENGEGAWWVSLGGGGGRLGGKKWLGGNYSVFERIQMLMPRTERCSWLLPSYKRYSELGG